MIIKSKTLNGLRFEWFGGAYIEIFKSGTRTLFDIINVWDYELDKPRISADDFAKTCEEYLLEIEW